MENTQGILDLISSLTINFNNQLLYKDKTIIELEHINKILSKSLSKSQQDNFTLQLEVDKLQNQLFAKQDTYDKIIATLEMQTNQTEHDFRLFGKELNSAYNVLERENYNLKELVDKYEKKLENYEKKYQDLVSSMISRPNFN